MRCLRTARCRYRYAWKFWASRTKVEVAVPDVNVVRLKVNSCVGLNTVQHVALILTLRRALFWTLNALSQPASIADCWVTTARQIVTRRTILAVRVGAFCVGTLTMVLI